MSAWLIMNMLRNNSGGSLPPAPPEDPNERISPEELEARRRRARIALTILIFFVAFGISFFYFANSAGFIHINIKTQEDHPVIAPDAPLGRYELIFPDGWKPVACMTSYCTSITTGGTWLCQPVDGRDIYRECRPTRKDLSP